MTEDTKRGEVVISVPRKCFMSTETAKDSSLSTLMDKDPMLKTMPNVALALHLVLEKNSPGFVTDAFLFTISFPLIDNLLGHVTCSFQLACSYVNQWKVFCKPRAPFLCPWPLSIDFLGPIKPSQKVKKWREIGNWIKVIDLTWNPLASYWEAYINVLPSKYSTVLYFTPQDFEELKGSPALEDALKQVWSQANTIGFFTLRFQIV